MFANVACPSTNHHMNSRLRKNVNSSGKLRKRQSGKRFSILIHMLVCHQFNTQVNNIHRSGQGNLWATLMLQWHLGQAITTQNPEVQEGQTDIHRVETKVEDTQIVVGKAAATAVALILNKAEGRSHTLVVGWVEQVARGVEMAVAMELADQIISRLALMACLAQAEGQTIPNKVVLAISSSMETGSNILTPSFSFPFFF